MDERTREILLITQEECAEVTQAISKCFRFGFENRKPGENSTNRQHLETEIGDVLCMIELLYESGVVDPVRVVDATNAKLEKLKTWSSIVG